MARRRRGFLGALVFPLFAGMVLLGIGAWAALIQLGAPLPGIEEMWPIFPLLGGGAFLVGFLLRPRAFGLVLPGTIAALLGLFFFTFTLGPADWDQMTVLWPVFPLIVGIAFVAMWAAAGFRYWGLLIPAGITCAAGMIGLALTVTPLGGVLGYVGWPVAILATGSSLVLVTLVAVALRTLRLVAGRP